ncbi:hypothetical protein HanIR_Chr04g0181051 [Helianthus annuus]|nr:hypothetical protein HanIR_Chr04g0181051 [Helianthus annuus]
MSGLRGWSFSYRPLVRNGLDFLLTTSLPVKNFITIIEPHSISFLLFLFNQQSYRPPIYTHRQRLPVSCDYRDNVGNSVHQQF